MISIRNVKLSDLPQVEKLQDACFASITNIDWLRQNTLETFQKCLVEPNYFIGVFDDETLAAIAILQICGQDQENLGYQLGYSAQKLDSVANMKLVLVAKEYRGKGYQKMLMDRCEDYALKQGIRVLATTVHPENTYSIRNVINCGYVFHSQHLKYGGLSRNLYFKNIGGKYGEKE